MAGYLLSAPGTDEISERSWVAPKTKTQNRGDGSVPFFQALRKTDFIRADPLRAQGPRDVCARNYVSKEN